MMMEVFQPGKVCCRALWNKAEKQDQVGREYWYPQGHGACGFCSVVFVCNGLMK